MDMMRVKCKYTDICNKPCMLEARNAGELLEIGRPGFKDETKINRFLNAIRKCKIRKKLMEEMGD